MSINQPDNKKYIPPIYNNKLAMGQEVVVKDPPYADPPNKDKEKAKSLKDVREKFAPNKDKPTTASGDPNPDLPSLEKQIDGQGLSSILPMLMSCLGSVNSSMNSFSQSSRKNIIEDALTGALVLLEKKYGFDQVIFIMVTAIFGDAYYQIDPVYRSIVDNAILNLIKLALEHGTGKIPTKTYRSFEYTIITPSPIVTPDKVPDLSIKQYYTAENDPYPGYIQWLLPEGTLSSENTNFVYTRMDVNDIPYDSIDEELYSISERELAKALDPYIKTYSLTAIILNQLLHTQDSNIEQVGMERGMGKNSSNNLMQLINMLLGIIGQIVNKEKNQHLPKSVLNQGKVNEALEKFSKNMGMLKKMKKDAERALGGMPGMSGMMSGFGSFGTGGISGITGMFQSRGSSSQAIGAISSILHQIGNRS